MLIAAFVILGIAVLMGSLLAVSHLYTGRALIRSQSIAAVHGLLAIGGFICLMLALRGPSRGGQTGTASFGMVAAGLIALASLAGGRMFVAHLRKMPVSQMAIGVHATLAVSGFVVLAAYIFAG
jgi:hypothetical protein